MSLPICRARAAAPLALLALVLAGCGGAPVGPVLPGERPGSAAPESSRARSESLVRLGDTALRSGEIETAVSLFDQATVLDAANVGAALGLGDALLAAGRDLDASRAFERALAVQPELPAAQYGYARAMLAIRRPEVAADFLHKLVAANPSDIASLNALGVSYDQMGEHDQASATYRQGLTIAPASVPLRNNLALSLALQNQFTEALDLIRPLAEGPDATRRSRQKSGLGLRPAGRSRGGRAGRPGRSRRRGPEEQPYLLRHGPRAGEPVGPGGDAGARPAGRAGRSVHGGPPDRAIRRAGNVRDACRGQDRATRHAAAGCRCHHAAEARLRPAPADAGGR